MFFCLLASDLLRLSLVCLLRTEGGRFLSGNGKLNGAVAVQGGLLNFKGGGGGAVTTRR